MVPPGAVSTAARSSILSTAQNSQNITHMMLSKGTIDEFFLSLHGGSLAKLKKRQSFNVQNRASESRIVEFYEIWYVWMKIDENRLN